MIRRKRKPKFKKIIFLLAVVFILLAIVLFFSKDYFLIKHLDISMSQIKCVTDNQIREVIGGTNRQSLFFLDNEKLRENLKRKYICIKNIVFSRSFPNKIKVEVFPRKAALELITLDIKQASASSIENISTPSAEEKLDAFLVDSEGMVFSKNEDLDIQKVFLYDSQISLGQNLGTKINDVLNILSKIKMLDLGVNKSWIDGNIFVVDSASNIRIIFKLNDKVDIQIASLQLILAEAKINNRTITTGLGMDSRKLEFIDLRFDKPIVRFAPKKN